MKTITYHRAECTDGALWLCSHAHPTVVSAVACIASAGDYIIALENGAFRALNNAEQAEYRYAIYGAATEHGIAPIEGCRKKRFT
ncbi:MAG TPA: hypothetical protein VJW20_24460 [Candidatus Angelobacter sp.]|nr:hypothetical protein [Candidatus Angelobacter sp.]